MLGVVYNINGFPTVGCKIAFIFITNENNPVANLTFDHFSSLFPDPPVFLTSHVIECQDIGSDSGHSFLSQPHMQFTGQNEPIHCAGSTLTFRSLDIIRSLSPH